jgi:DNA polymerase-3 subunit beta
LTETDPELVAVIPAIAISHLQRIMGGAKPPVIEFAFAGKLVFIRLAIENGLQIELTSRLVEGAFPNYQGALAAQSTGQVTFSAGELASAVRRAALMTNQTSRGIVMALEAGKAVFSNLNYTNGSVRIPVACDYNGLTCKLGLNAQYLSDVLKVWSKDRIDIEISRGLVMREPGVTYLIMPISLPG